MYVFAIHIMGRIARLKAVGADRIMREHAKHSNPFRLSETHIKILLGTAVTQTMFGRLTAYRAVANFRCVHLPSNSLGVGWQNFDSVNEIIILS